MPETFILANGVQTRIDDKEFEEGLKTGRFGPGDLYWREGMAVWLPIPVSSEAEPARDPETLIASMHTWTQRVRRVFLAAAVFGVLAMPWFAGSQTDGFKDSNSILGLIILLFGFPVAIAFFVAGIAVYIIPAIWLYRLGLAAEFCEKPMIPPQFVAVAWCIPLANMIVPVVGLISLAKAAGSAFPRAAWVIVGASIAGVVFQFAGVVGAESAKHSFILSFIFAFWLLCDAARYLAWRTIATDFSSRIEMRIRELMTEPVAVLPCTDELRATQTQQLSNSMQDDTSQQHKTQAMPPPPPQVVYVNPAQTIKTTKQKWPGIIAMISVVIAGLGVLPVLVFVMSCFPSYSYGYRYGAGLSHFVFFFIGFVLHGTAGVAGLVGMLNGARLPGLVGLIGNAVILVLAVIGLLIGVS